MSGQQMTPTDHLVGALLMGSIFVYFLWGAIADDLYLPGKHGPGIHLHGLSAWLATAAPLLVYIGLLVRGGTFYFRNDKIQGAFEFLLVLGGLAALVVSIQMAP